MTTNEKIIKNKLNLQNLAQQYGNASQACRVMGNSQIVFIISSSFTLSKVKSICR